MQDRSKIFKQIQDEGLNRDKNANIVELLNPGYYTMVKFNDSLSPKHQPIFKKKYAEQIQDRNYDTNPALMEILEDGELMTQIKRNIIAAIAKSAIAKEYGLTDVSDYDFAGLKENIQYAFRYSSYKQSARKTKPEFITEIIEYAAAFYTNKIAGYINDQIALRNPNHFIKPRTKRLIVKRN